MNKISLSQYGANQIKAARELREAGDRAKQKQYDQTIQAVHAQREQASSKFIAAAKNGEIFSATGNLFSWIFHNVKMLPVPPRCADMGIQERCFESGIFGEDQVERHIEAEVNGQRLVVRQVFLDGDQPDYDKIIGGALTHSISGYRNRKGEIDLIEVTPWGILALEVKNVAGLVYTRGPDWFRDKYSHAGYKVEEGVPITDRGGRSPARQLIEPTDLLQAMLAKHGHEHKIQRVVVLAHPSGFVGDIDFNHSPVDMVTNVAQLDVVGFLRKRKVQANLCYLDADEIEAVSALIQADHARFNRARA